MQTEVDERGLVGGSRHGRLERKKSRTRKGKVKWTEEWGAREEEVNQLPLSNSETEAEVKLG